LQFANLKMVLFSNTLQVHSVPGWRYINYERLKIIIGRVVAERKRKAEQSLSDIFFKLLLSEIEDVDFFPRKVLIVTFRTEEGENLFVLFVAA